MDRIAVCGTADPGSIPGKRTMEGWPSGLWRMPRKRVDANPQRFESSTLRIFKKNMSFKKIVILILVVLVIAVPFYFYMYGIDIRDKIVSPKSEKKENSKKEVVVKNTGYFAQYNFENLRNREYEGLKITKIGKALIVEEGRKELIRRGDLEGKTFNFETSAISFESNGKKISGMMNIPLTPKSSKMPAIIMIRGFAESMGYFIGSGSWKAADELARNGYITVSLDFLGFGLSDNESTDILEARFENMNIVDPERIGIWAHSNGGQIAVSVLEITGENYPTVLWAPMTNPFPKSVLDTVDDNSEGSLRVKQKIEDFEKEYDSNLYSIDNFYDWINSSIIIHQGTNDVWCEVKWQKKIKSELKSLGKEITLDIRNGSDHNLKQSWDEVIKMDIDFFNGKFK
jgi:Prolyl oligopeptidase family